MAHASCTVSFFPHKLARLRRYQQPSHEPRKNDQKSAHRSELENEQQIVAHTRNLRALCAHHLALIVATLSPMTGSMPQPRGNDSAINTENYRRRRYGSNVSFLEISCSRNT